MSDRQKDDEGSEWIFVDKNHKRAFRRGKKGRGRTNKFSPQTKPTHHSTPEDFDPKRIEESLKTMQNGLVETDFFRVLGTLLERIPHDRTPTSLVCYGIGNFASPRSASMWQLALALALRSTRKELEGIYFFDPCTTTPEEGFLKERDVRLIGTNERGKRRVAKNTLFFMPHCPMKLYQNLFVENWGKQELSRVVILGNSMQEYGNRTIGKIPEFLSLLLPFLKEEHVAYSKPDVSNSLGSFETAFNDLYLTWFVCDHSSDFPPCPDRGIENEDDAEVL